MHASATGNCTHAPQFRVKEAEARRASHNKNRQTKKAKSETARIAAIRELLDRGYGRPRQVMEVSVPADNPLQLLFDEIDALSRVEPPVSHTPNRDQLSPGFNRADRARSSAPTTVD
jgi:hypothetical protein